jgi:hypothetical protein
VRSVGVCCNGPGRALPLPVISLWRRPRASAESARSTSARAATLTKGRLTVVATKTAPTAATAMSDQPAEGRWRSARLKVARIVCWRRQPGNRKLVGNGELPHVASAPVTNRSPSAKEPILSQPLAETTTARHPKSSLTEGDGLNPRNPGGCELSDRHRWVLILEVASRTDLPELRRLGRLANGRVRAGRRRDVARPANSSNRTKPRNPICLSSLRVVDTTPSSPSERANRGRSACASARYAACADVWPRMDSADRQGTTRAGDGVEI